MKVDPSTLSNYYSLINGTERLLKNTALKLFVNWESRIISGSVKLSFESLRSQQIVLDTSALKINGTKFNKQPVEFSLGKLYPPLGTPLTIDLPVVDQKGDNELEILFETTVNCTALQWLNAEQTAGKKAPYMFSQCEAIHARSLFPCFDTPSVKSKYTVEVTSEFPIVIGGRLVSKTNKDSQIVSYFEQPVPIPSYLFAIAGGDLASAPIGKRSSVWCEPSQVADCQWEFEGDMEKFLEAAEKIVFPYEWGTYDLLVLPPSFPFGGMENPNMTFVTPTLIAGDRTLVNVVAHELAHSWSGNLVTNSSWEHFWLNEGWTVYLERRILAEMQGESYRHFEMIMGWADLKESIESMGESASKFSKLVVDLQNGVDPDDAFSTVPYEKGSTFLFYLENLFGKAQFDKFVPFYFTKFRTRSLDTDMFIETLGEFFTGSENAAKIAKIDWNLWLHTPGLPPKPEFDTSLATPCFDLANRWSESANTNDYSWADPEKDLANWTSKQMQVFLDSLLQKLDADSHKYRQEAIKALDTKYKLSTRKNTEVLFRWYRLALSSKIKEAEQPLATWLTQVGRMKYVRPGYKLLAANNRELAVKLFNDNKDFYHPICRSMVAKDLGLNN